MQKWILLFSLFLCLKVWSQNDLDSLNSTFEDKKIPTHRIKALYGFLSQDGNNSPVTGGKGTEELEVHSARVLYVKNVEKNNKWIIKSGLDNISSASTDNIDFVVSSASAHDYRVQLNVGLNHTDTLDTTSFGGYLSTSLESDYFSRGIGANYQKKNKKGGVSKLKANFFWDELRWGIITAEIFDFKTMVYPVELRDTAWFNISHRNTFNVSGKYSFITSVRSKMGFLLDITYQQGVLSTPFHRAYFSDGSLRVEKLPFNRLRLPFSLQYNYFLGSGLILKNNLRYSWDSFGVESLTYKLQTPIKLNYFVWLKPFVRFYSQSSSFYFRPYAEHLTSSRYYTSDYDLSKFWALNYGIGIKVKKKVNWTNLNGVEWLIENYSRQGGLYFWQISVMIDFSF